jgi:hypothetical protein
MTNYYYNNPPTPIKTYISKKGNVILPEWFEIAAGHLSNPAKYSSNEDQHRR